MWAILQPGSSPVDWCEENYKVSPLIAEFVNTFSNLIFFLLAPMEMHLFRDYARIINPGIHLIWFSLFIVGVSSAYFHATLSLLGQLLDEVAILWAYFAAFAMFFPRRHFPRVFNGDRKRLTAVVVIVAIAGTVLSVIHPAVNAFVLMTLGVPAITILIKEVRRDKSARIHILGIQTAIMWSLSVFCWINDKLFCEAWTAVKFPYLHALWHVFIYIAASSACALFAYFSVKEEIPEKKAVLRYWPRNDYEFGVPYVLIKAEHVDLNDEI